MIQAHVKKINKKRGFTIAEIMVSVAIFAIIMVTGMGALVNMTQKLRISQYQKKAIDSLSFVLESMTREIRLGTKYQFQPNLNGSDNGTVRNGQDTFTGNPDEGIIGFESSDGRGYMIYYLLEGEIFRKTFDANIRVEKMTDASQVVVKSVRTLITNTDPLPNDRQPMVWLQISAYSPGYPDAEKNVQTLVSQRVLDR